MPLQHTRSHIPSGAKGSEYRQDVCTPQSHWSVVLQAVRRRRFDIDLFCDDRTAGNVPAKRYYRFPREDALELPWQGDEGRDRKERYSAWGNPPFGDLARILERAAGMDWSDETNAELTLLVPLRPHRVYWRHAHTSDLEVHLPAFAFDGEENTFPLPCCLLYWGPDAKRVGLTLRELGAVVRWGPLTENASTASLPVVVQHNKPTFNFTILESALRVVQVTSRASSRHRGEPAPYDGLQESSSVAGMANASMGYGKSRAALRAILAHDPDDIVYKPKQVQGADAILACACKDLDHAIAFWLIYLPLAKLHLSFAECAKYIPARLGRLLQDELAAAKKAAAKPAKKATKKVAAKPAKKATKKPPKPAAKKAAKKPPKRQLAIPATNGSTATADVEAFVATKKPGDVWSKSEIKSAASSASILRACNARQDIEQVGAGRGARWQFVAGTAANAAPAAANSSEVAS